MVTRNTNIKANIGEANKNVGDVLSKVRIEIKELIFQNNIRQSINKLKNSLVKHSKPFDNLVAISARYKRIDEYSHQNLISFQETEIEMAKIVDDIMFMVNNLNSEGINTES